jgi:hypothetical protein
VGEIRTWTDREVYLNVLRKEISVLQTKYQPHEEGTGHFNTAISVLESRIKEIESEMNWPFPNE